MTRHTPPPAPFDGWIPLTEYASEAGLSVGTARVRAWRALRGTYEDPGGYEFIRAAPQEPRSTVLARRRPQPSQ